MSAAWFAASSIKKVGKARFSNMDLAVISICLTEFSAWALLLLSSGELYRIVTPTLRAMAWNSLLSLRHSPAGSSFRHDIMGLLRSLNNGFALDVWISSSIFRVNSFRKMA